MKSSEELKRFIHRNVSLCQIIEPLGEKRDCTTRTRDCNPRAKLEYFLISGVNSSWPFYDLAGEIIKLGKQPSCIYKHAYESQIASTRNRGGGKINFGQISLLLPLVTSQVLGVIGGKNMGAEEICGGVKDVLKNTTPKDVEYLERFIALARKQSYESHIRHSYKIKQKGTKLEYASVWDAAQNNSQIHIVNETITGYPYSLEIYNILKNNVDKGIIAGSEIAYDNFYPERIERFDAAADLIVSAFYLMFTTHPKEKLLV